MRAILRASSTKTKYRINSTSVDMPIRSSSDILDAIVRAL